jgi:hypothetical protein
MAYYIAFGDTPGITKLELQFFRMNEDEELVVASGGGRIDYLSFTPAAVPEPATMFLLGSGLIGIGIFVRKK